MKDLLQALLLPVSVAITVWMLSKSKGAWYRLACLPEVLRGDVTRWVRRDVGRRRDRIGLALVMTTAYLTSTIPEIIEMCRELRARVLVPEERDRAAKDTWHFLRMLWRRPGALAVISSLAAAADVIAAACMSSEDRAIDAVGHLSTPIAMVLVLLAISEVTDGVRTTTHSPHKTFVWLAFRWMFLACAIALTQPGAWGAGAGGARLVGFIGLVMAAVGSLLPMNSWIESNITASWFRFVGPTLIIGASVLGAAATVWELATMSEASPMLIAGNMLGAVAFVGAGYVLGMLAFDPPNEPPFEEFEQMVDPDGDDFGTDRNAPEAEGFGPERTRTSENGSDGRSTGGLSSASR